MRVVLVLAAISVAMAGCSRDAEVERDGGQVYIVDRTGKRWEVTYAESNYGFEPSEFQYGIGPNAIRPLNDPTFVAAGDPGFPAADNPMRILGTTIGGESRAYPIGRMGRWEVINDWFGDVPVAPAY